MNNSITIEHISKCFRKIPVLSDVSAEFESGKIHGIIGHNGSGKTVLMKIICGLMDADSGEVFINGERQKNGSAYKSNIGAIIETPGFLPTQSGFKNLQYLASIRCKIGDEEIKSAMKKVNLNPDEKKHVGKYSLGMRQRLGLAQAIMENPELLILDEPMNGLDKDGVCDMRKYLLNLKSQGKTILIASHSAEDIDVLCDTVCEMDKGNLKKVR
ncbi:MAG: ATP-binding cassette domain-containing protein [Oscillospiraceae bacterium]|nr:ATP-binding cassette domain-containing protein [Oscillospiraceae bacterium]